ncbi:MAG: type IV pilin N-terminal domain-containing protein, partial [Methanolinea sp.]|nr:type IV pilin N-terminal domain-containing protein [Methanolinea sp.]
MSTAPRDAAVSEILGALLLIAVVSLAVSIVGVAILSNTETGEIPSVTVKITNISRTIYLAHEGGDSLPPGFYRIYVDGTDRTDSFTD